MIPSVVAVGTGKAQAGLDFVCGASSLWQGHWAGPRAPARLGPSWGQETGLGRVGTMGGRARPALGLAGPAEGTSMVKTAVWVALAIFLILFGLFAVTNVEVAWGKPLMGFAALAAGVLIVVMLVSQRPTSGPS